ncbi:MAG: DNA-directed RNA polymerase subunit alpha [Victivallales bacterium]|nr:DNA-directed RNA polymerase subunit alpha [Victivallales bacterium]
MANTEIFQLPQKIEMDETTATDRYAKFIAEPWENGYGHTIGNALRRVLLSSMEGVAVSSVRIEGVKHEFCSMPDVVEDVMDIVLNIKKLKFLCASDVQLPRHLELVRTEAGVVTAADIQEDGVIKVLNPEQVLCTLDTKRSADKALRMDFEIDRGRGFRPSEENKHPEQAIDVIPVDSLFSPIERVRYDVQACRVGQRTDYDRLVLEVWTDGRIKPQAALSTAVSLLRRSFDVFGGGECIGSYGFPGLNSGLSIEDKELVDKLCTSVSELDLSVRAVNCLNSAQIHYVSELVEKSEAQMLKFRNFGKVSLQEIQNKLAEMGLSLEMTLSDAVKEELANRAVKRIQTNSEENE